MLDAPLKSYLQPLLERDGRGHAVAFDADGTLWRGDVGEDFLRLAAHEQRYPLLKGRRGVFEEYERRVAADPASAYAFCVEVLEGVEETRVRQDAEAFFAARFLGRIFSAARLLTQQFKRKGYDVWIVSASPHWQVAAGAKALGIPEERVIAVTCRVDDGGVLRPPVTLPVPCFDGKVAQLKARGIRPLIAFGNGELDQPMLEYAEHAVVVAPHGDPGNGLVRAAQGRSWPILRA